MARGTATVPPSAKRKPFPVKEIAMRFLVFVFMAAVAGTALIGCDDSSSSSGSGAKAPKRIPPITVNNPFDNASFSWKGYNDLDQIDGTVRCTSSGVGTIG